MKKILLLASFIALAFISFSQEKGAKETSIPQQNGKVIFSDTIHSELTKEEMQARISAWLNYKFLPKRGIMNVNDSINRFISCQVLDYLEVEKKKFSMFAMYMRYSFVFQFGEQSCIASIKDISYIEFDRMASDNYSKDDFMSGEFVMIEKKYRPVFVKDASKRLTDKTVQRVEEIFASLKSVLDQND